MHIHVLRVQETKSQRTWWIKGDNAEDDLMKFKPPVTQIEAIHAFELRHNCSVTKLYTYKDEKGECDTPATAAMTVADIIRKHKDE